MYITFHLKNAFTTMGEEIRLCGNLPQLGAWNVSNRLHSKI